MSKVENYINDHIRKYRVPVDYSRGYYPWLSRNEAREVAMIAREETVEEVCKWLNLNLGMLLKVLNVEYNIEDETDIKDFIEDLKKAML